MIIFLPFICYMSPDRLFFDHFVLMALKIGTDYRHYLPAVIFHAQMRSNDHNFGPHVHFTKLLAFTSSAIKL